MTLEEYQKVLEEKRKALQALKTEERKVDVDKELKSMQQLSNKKDNDDIFIKLVNWLTLIFHFVVSFTTLLIVCSVLFDIVL